MRLAGERSTYEQHSRRYRRTMHGLVEGHVLQVYRCSRGLLLCMLRLSIRKATEMLL